MSHLSPAKRSITNFLTSPCAVARSLDWKRASGSILSLSITKNHINLVVSSHPEYEESPRVLDSIPLEMHKEWNRKVLDPTVSDALANVIKNFNVCGMVVSWPVQREGWCGASCGRVLHTLDQLAAEGGDRNENGNRVLSPSRPVCLYDCHHHLPVEDEWGRSPVYSEICTKKVHIASEEQYKKEVNSAALAVWNDFSRTYWPDVFQEVERSGVGSLYNDTKHCEFSSKKLNDEDDPDCIDLEFLESYEDNDAYIPATMQ